MKKILLLVAAVVAIFTTSCSRSVTGYVDGKTNYSFSLIDDNGNVIDVAIIKTQPEVIRDICVNDYVKIKFNTLRTDNGNYRSLKELVVLQPGYARRITGFWNLDGSENVRFVFASENKLRVEGLDANYVGWSVSEKPGQTALLNLRNLAIGEEGFVNEEISYGFSLSEDGNSLTITDKETGETVWDLTRAPLIAGTK